MARDIIIIPNRDFTGSTEQPEIRFSGLTGASITLKVEDDGAIVFEGDTGGLFEINDNKDGLLSAVSDVSGLPIFAVYSDDRVIAGKWDDPGLTVSGGTVFVGPTGDTTSSLHVSGATTMLGNLNVTNSAIIQSGGTDLYNIFLTETPKQNVASESNASGSINTTMTESAYPHDTIISINPSTALNTVRYTLPAPTAGLKYTFVLNASAAASVTVSVGYTTDVLGGFIHTSTLDGLRSDTGIGRVQLDAASGVFYDKFEFTSDGSKWYYVVYHNGAATDITITSNA